MDFKVGSTVRDQHGVEWVVIREVDEKGEIKLASEAGVYTGQIRLVRDERAS